MEPLLILTIFGAIILLGFIGHFIFDKTQIPDIIWLLLFGIIMGSGFHILSPDQLASIAPTLAALALAIILFDGGLNMNFYKVLREFPRATFLAILGVILAMLSIALVAALTLGWSPLHGLLLGAIVGGSSSAIVIPLVRGIEIRDRITMMLSLESTLTDSLCIILGIVILGIITGGNVTISSVANDILSAFSIAAVIGTIIGIAWLFIYDKIKDLTYSHRLNLAALLLLYAFIEYVGGSGAIGALFFGIVLGNGKYVSDILRFRKTLEMDRGTKTFQSDVTFFVKTFFFVFLGMMVTISDLNTVLMGVAMSVILLLVRIPAVLLSTMKCKFERWERSLMAFMIPRGLAAAVLAQLPLIYGLENHAEFSNLTFIIIISTIIICIIGVSLLKPPEEEEKKD